MEIGRKQRRRKKMELNYKINSKDFIAMMRSPYFNGAGRLKGIINKGAFFTILALGVLAFAIDALSFFGEQEAIYDVPLSVPWCGGALGMLSSRYVMMPIYYRWYFKRSNFDDETTLLFAEDGIFAKSIAIESRLSGHSIVALERTKDHYFIWISKVQAIIIPRRFIDQDLEPKFQKILLDLNDNAVVLGFY